jgi:hypothetical protein
MKREATRSLKAFLIELGVYAALVVGYFLLVLRYLGDWIEHLYHHNRHLYSIVALALIVSQGIVLEAVTTALLKWIRARREGE